MTISFMDGGVVPISIRAIVTQGFRCVEEVDYSSFRLTTCIKNPQSLRCLVCSDIILNDCGSSGFLESDWRTCSTTQAALYGTRQENRARQDQ